ncbi:MAG: MarR family winged helix-turn-helix transcriptional regulator [Pseudoclavibacter sp.]
MQNQDESVGEHLASLFQPLASSLGHLVRRTQQLHTLSWVAHVTSGVTSAQYAILTVVAGYPDSPRMMVDRLAALDRSTSADVISRLEANRWIERARAEHDARRSELALTPPARAALPLVTEQVRAVQHHLLRDLDDAERAEVEVALATVAYADVPDLRDQEPSDATAPILDFATTPTHLLRRVEQRHQRLWSAHVGSLATPTQYAVMCAIADGTLDQKSVGSLASLDTSTTADVLSRLRRQGLVEVTPDARDRRRNLVRLAPAAHDLLRNLTPRAEDVHRNLRSPLGEAAAERLKSLLRRVSLEPGDPLRQGE